MPATAKSKKTQQPYCQPSKDSWVTAIIFLPALFGFIINCWNCWRLLKFRKARGSFALLWTSRCSANAIILFIFMFYTSPSILCNRQFPNKSIGYFIANSTGTYYLTVMFVQILLAIHRFCASLNDKLFKLISSTRATLIQLAISWCIGIFSTLQWVVGSFFSSVVFYFCMQMIISKERCEFWFDISYWSWENKCAEWIIEISTSIPVKITLVIIIVLNFATFIRLYVLQKQKKHNISTYRLKTNFRLLWQGTIHDSFFFFDIVNQDYTSQLHDNKWWYLLCYSISWEWSHTLDGLAILLVNEDLRKPIVRLFRRRNSTSLRHISITRVEFLRSRHS